MAHKWLCIESSRSIRKLMTELGRSKGWTVVACADLAGVAKALGTGGVDLVTLPSILPSGSYREAVGQLRRMPGLEAVPIILLTSDQRESMAAGAPENGVTKVFLRQDLESFLAYLQSFNPDNVHRSLAGLGALVVDDDRVEVDFFRQVLSRLGMEVHLSTTLSNAEAALAQHDYHLILINITLAGGRPGNQFVRKVRQTRGTEDLPVIVISGFADDARRLDALRAGSSLFLVKPVAEAELSFHVHRLLSMGAGELRRVAVDRSISRFLELSKQEQAICRLVASGYTDKQVATQLGISYWTVRTHIARIFRKCGVLNRIELASLVHGNPQEKLSNDWVSLAPQVIEQLQHGVIITDEAQRIIYANGAFSRVTGYTQAEVLGQTPRILKSGKHEAHFYADMFETLRTQGTWSGEVWNRHKDGSLYLEWLSLHVLQAETPMGARYVGIISDVTERRLEMERIRYHALHDALTNVANRTLLRDRFIQAANRARRNGDGFCVIFIDLDHFKLINDNHGHETGDRVLVEVARRLNATFRGADTVARFGGDEFVVLAVDIPYLDSATLMAGKVSELFSPPIRVNGLDHAVGASVGISFYPDHGEKLEHLVNLADRAMYQAKKNSGGVVVWPGEGGRQAAGGDPPG